MVRWRIQSTVKIVYENDGNSLCIGETKAYMLKMGMKEMPQYSKKRIEEKRISALLMKY